MPTAAARESLLIVDDDSLIRQMLSDLASEAGFHPLTAATIAQGRSVLQQETVAGAMLDYTLEGETGEALCHWLRMQEKTWSLPVLMVTSLDQADVLRRCLVAGVDDFIPKPVEPHEVLLKLKALRGGGEPGFQRKLEKKRVLLATAQPFYLNNVAKLLTQSGCAVEIASDRDGLSRSLSGRTPPEVAVFDLGLWTPEDLEWARRLEIPTATPMYSLYMQKSAVTLVRPPQWKNVADRIWSSVLPMDADEERDELLRHISRVVTLGTTKGNTRRKPRVPFYSAVRFRWTDQTEWMHGLGFDLSESGIFVRTVAPLRPARKTVEMTFKMEDGSVANAWGMVVWANAQGPRHLMTVPFGMGISFTEISEETSDTVRRYVSRRTRPHSD
jgi:DNA-binding response OmpR family regulator